MAEPLLLESGPILERLASDRSSPPTSGLPASFFARPSELVAPALIGCLLVKRQADGDLLWGVLVETEAYSQDDPACHGYRRRSPSNETLFGEPGRFYVYVSYGIHHCVKRARISKTAGWA
jgi:DNA-3-methyladenine glycosylase